MARSIAAKAIQYASKNDDFTGDYEVTIVDFQNAVPAVVAIMQYTVSMYPVT